MNRSIIPDTEWVSTAPPSPTPISSRLQSHPSLENFVILSDPSTEATEGSCTGAEVQTDDGNSMDGGARTTAPSHVDALQQDKKELHTGPANIFRNYKIKPLTPLGDVTEKHQNSLQREMPRGTGIFSKYHPQPTTTWFPRPQEAPKPLHPHHFGGLCFDFDRNTWSTCHVIENNGVIEDRSRNLYDIGNVDGADGAMIDHDLDIVGQLGLAAGKIYLRGRKIVSMSGFFLEKRLFVSAAPFEEALGKQFLHGKISTLRLSEIGADPWIREAELIYLDHISDITVYRLLRGVPDPENWCSLGQLVPGNQIKEGSRVFTVGYNGTSNRQDFFANADAYFTNLSPSKQEELRLCGVRAAPEFETVFAPNQRTVAVGTLIGPGTNPAGTLYHTVSGWYGMSGAMMGFLKDEEIKVFGIYAGGYDEHTHNFMRPFTEDMIAKLSEMAASPTTALEEPAAALEGPAAAEEVPSRIVPHEPALQDAASE